MRWGLSEKQVKITIRDGKIYRLKNLTVKYLFGDDYLYSPVVSKSQGGAVERNRLKRVIRGIMSSNKSTYPNGSYLIYYYGACKAMKRKNLVETINAVAKRISLNGTI